MLKPILSIVTPTREGFSEHWLKKLLEVKGDIEFILVHPPGMTKASIDDPRVQQINSPLRGEVIQRITGLTNASGTYTISLNCDEYLTPDISEIVFQYFKLCSHFSIVKFFFLVEKYFSENFYSYQLLTTFNL